MTEIILTRDTCDRTGCLASLRYGPQPVVMVFTGAAQGISETVRVYCSHRCECLDRPKAKWSGRLPWR